MKVHGMASEEELFASVDALLEEEPQLPPPAERARLREAAQDHPGPPRGRFENVDADGEELRERPLGTEVAAPGGLPAAPEGVGGEVPRAHFLGRARTGRRAAAGGARDVHRLGRPGAGGGCRAGSGPGRPGGARTFRTFGDVAASGGQGGCRARRRPALPPRPARRAGRRRLRVRRGRDRAGLPGDHDPGAGGVDAARVRPRCRQAQPLRQGLRPADRAHRGRRREARTA